MCKELPGATLYFDDLATLSSNVAAYVRLFTLLSSLSCEHQNRPSRILGALTRVRMLIAFASWLFGVNLMQLLSQAVVRPPPSVTDFLHLRHLCAAQLHHLRCHEGERPSSSVLGRAAVGCLCVGVDRHVRPLLPPSEIVRPSSLTMAIRPGGSRRGSSWCVLRSCLFPLAHDFRL